MTTLEKAQLWLTDTFDDDTKSIIKQWIAGNPDELEDSFYRELEFGTGGMRGIMGVGTNRLNRYTLGQATQGLANYLNSQFAGEEIKVAIAYDVRNNSKEFGKMCADVLTTNGIKFCFLKNTARHPNFRSRCAINNAMPESYSLPHTIHPNTMVIKCTGTTVHRLFHHMMRPLSKKFTQ